MNKVSIVIPVYGQIELTINCLKDLINTYGVTTEIIVVDDCSKDNTVKIVEKLFPNVILLKNDENLGFAKTVNKGIDAASNDLICLLNNDIRLPNPKWLSIMTNSMSSLDMTAPAGGRMDSKWNYQPGEAKCSGDKFAFLVGWCLLIKKDVIDSIGKMPEDFGRGFFEDVLFSHRAKKAGFKLGITEGTDVQHLYHATFKAEGYDLAKEYNDKRDIFLNIIGIK